MAQFVSASGLAVDAVLHEFVTDELLPGTGIGGEAFFAGLAAAVRDLAPRNRELLRERERMQAAIDRWHLDDREAKDPDATRAFLAGIGYLVAPGPEFRISTSGVDPEIAELDGPQLVVPVTNARYALNAVNARWGSLYDALYGTDALGDEPPAGSYDPQRGARVIAWVRELLDEVVPLQHGSHRECAQYRVDDGRLIAVQPDGEHARLRDPSTFVGYVGSPDEPAALLFRHHGLGIELRIDRDHAVGATDRAGVADVALEAAVTTIVDFEDSVAAVDADDKVVAYRNWLQLMTGTLEASVEHGGASHVRRLHEDRRYTAPDGSEQRLRVRALMLARTVGPHMTTAAVSDPEGEPIPERILDTFVVAAAALHDAARPVSERNARHGAVYLVQPKMHGPDEVRLATDVFAAAERTLGLPADTLKMGIMDEERRTTVNLRECIRAASRRVVFVNTGFLDRTGDEIHTAMHAGPMLRKGDMRSSTWIRAYEDWNVDVALRCGFTGRAQIGKGMWAMPDRMHEMLREKLAHPAAGANCAWVPSPTAATLHATHYHRVDVRARQRELAGGSRATLDELLTIPVAAATWSADERREELDNNIQSILGYVVRWVDQGIGCSKVPDLFDVDLMEDRATCRISSQHVANWLLHRIVSAGEVDDSLRRMAGVVDAQNAADPAYRPMAPACDGLAFVAARELVFLGARAPSGYTEPVLHHRRIERKSLTNLRRQS